MGLKPEPPSPLVTGSKHSHRTPEEVDKLFNQGRGPTPDLQQVLDFQGLPDSTLR